MDKKYVYEFNEGDETMRELLGGKGANLAGMSKLGMPVPYGFTITTEACNQYYEDNETINDGIKAVREMIVSKTAAQRRVALEKILPMQRSYFF
jgi:phosphoenolpyruvate synthase/pyruvate phosphate dikinase